MKIVLNNYNKLLENLKNLMNQTNQNISKIIIRENVTMSWQIGKKINEHLDSVKENNTNSEYGKYLMSQLEKDIVMPKRTIYKMLNFYKSYPVLPEENSLAWSHYRVLGEIDDAEKRKYLENLTIENNLSSRQLEQEVKKIKNNVTEDTNNPVVGTILGLSEIAPTNDTQSTKESQERTGQDMSLQEQEKQKKQEKKLEPTRGVLFTYKLKKFEGSDKIYLDCGFNFYKTIDTELTEDGLVVESSKSEDRETPSNSLFERGRNREEEEEEKKYFFEKSSVKHQQTNTYKAVIEKVVDGDTLTVILDLGFGDFHKEILRLKGIDAPEMKTPEGQASAKALSEILKDVKFVVVKTIKTDIYGRYVADVFFGNGDAQSVADNGKYLNQILLDKGLAVRLMM